VTEPQVWVLIGVFAAALFGVIGIMTSLTLRVIRTEIGALRSEFARLETKMEAGFAAVDRRFEYLERDVNALYRHTFGIDKE